MAFPSIDELANKAKSAFKRFPVALIWTILGTFFLIWAIEVTNGNPFDSYAPELYTFILGISWFIGLQFFIEQQKRRKKWIWAKLGLIIALILFYYYLSTNIWVDNNPIYYLRFALYLIAGHLFVLFSPFIKNWNTNAYWNFLKNVSISIIRSGFFAFILYLGLVLALVAIDSLFDINIKGRTYGQLFTLCLGIVNTWIYLTDFPEEIRKNTDINFQKPLEVLVKFILIPLVILYLIILYSYSFKIVSEWNLPKGWVSYLVIALSFLGLTIQVIINPVATKIKSWTINKFLPWFYILLLPMIALLFVSIFRRTADYGITENRYFVILIACWILGITIYMLLAKKKRLITLPISLFIIALLSSFGIWGAISVSKKSQLAQFENTFQQVINNGKIATHAQIKQLKSITKYFNKRDAVSTLDAVTKLNVHDIVNRDDVDDELNYRNYKWTDSQKLIDSLGIKGDANSIAIAQAGNYYSIYNDNLSPVLNITGYHQFLELRAYTMDGFSNPNEKLSYKLNDKNMHLDIILKNNQRTLPTIDLKPTISALVKKNKLRANLKDEELTVIIENDSLDLKFIINELQVDYQKDSQSLSQVSGYLFIKYKKTP